MWPNPQESVDLLKKSLMENFIFCAVSTDPCEELVKLGSGPDI